MRFRTLRTLKNYGRRPAPMRYIVAALTLLAVGGCETTQQATGPVPGEIHVIHGQEPDESDDFVFVDLDVFTVRAWQRKQIDTMASAYARSVNANVAYIQITGESDDEITFTATVFRQHSKG